MEDVNKLLNSGEAVVFDSTVMTDYIITNQGNIYSKNKKTGDLHLRKLRTDRYGYQSIVIKNKCYKPHRLVAENFIPNPNNYSDVHHIKNKYNNDVDSLKWVSSEKNKEYFYKDNFGQLKTTIRYNKSLNIVEYESSYNHKKEKELIKKIEQFSNELHDLLNEAVKIDIKILKDNSWQTNRFMILLRYTKEIEVSQADMETYLLANSYVTKEGNEYIFED